MFNLFLRRWNVDQCKQNFDIFIKQIFKFQNKENLKPLRHLRRFFKCWLFDEYYYVKPFENTLKLIFDSSIKMFDFHDSNNTKVAVTAITISDALSYVIFNYNDKVKRSSDLNKQSCKCLNEWWLNYTKYQHLRSIDVNNETFIWKAWIEVLFSCTWVNKSNEKATSVAPMYDILLCRRAARWPWLIYFDLFKSHPLIPSKTKNWNTIILSTLHYERIGIFDLKLRDLAW